MKDVDSLTLSYTFFAAKSSTASPSTAKSSDKPAKAASTAAATPKL